MALATDLWRQTKVPGIAGGFSHEGPGKQLVVYGHYYGTHSMLQRLLAYPIPFNPCYLQPVQNRDALESHKHNERGKAQGSAMSDSWESHPW